MQKFQMAEKKRIYWDGDELDSLAKVDEITLTKMLVDVPGFKIIHQVSADITKMPLIGMEYVIRRDGNAYKFLYKFYEKNEVKDLVISRTDAHGDEFARTIWEACECVELVEPPYDASAPTYAKVSAKFTAYSRLRLV